MARSQSHYTSRVQLVVMAALVATIMYVPCTLPLAIAFRLAGVPFATFVTFGGVFNLLFGLVAWWVVVFAGACIYAVCLFPHDDKVLGWPKR